MTKTGLLQQLRAIQKTQDAYLAAVPQDLQCAVYDNGYTDATERANQLLMEAAFGSAYEDASWLLYEFKPGFSITEADGTAWTFADDSEFYIYFRKVVGE